MYPLEKRLAVLLDIKAKVPYKVLMWKHGIASRTINYWKQGLRFDQGAFTIMICKRCGEKFDYIRKRAPRFYCEPCKVLKRRDNLIVSNRKSYQKRMENKK